MNIALLNPPTLHRAKSADEINVLEKSNNFLPYYDRLLSLDESKEKGYSTLPGEHLGLQSIAAYAEAKGHSVIILNACLEKHSSLKQTLNVLKKIDFNLLGLTGPLDVFGENVWIASQLRDSGFTGHITLGHDFATLNHSIILENYSQFDSIVRGEGEITFCELSDRLESMQSLKGCLGLSFRSSDGRVIINSPRPPISNLDLLPWVKRTSLNQVISIGMSPSIYTKRGCPYHCSFCTTGSVPKQEDYSGDNRWRKRSPKLIVDEIEHIKSHQPIPFLTIVDDLFTAKSKNGSEHALAFAHEILARKIHVDFMIDCRADSIAPDTFSLLKRAGLRKVFVGIESGSTLSLQSFNKGYHPSIIYEKLKILEELDLDVVLGFIMFNPLDNLNGLEKSYHLIMDLDQQDFGLFLQEVRIYPGTPLYNKLLVQDQLKGTFPYFNADYNDEKVAHICTLLSEFGNLAVPLLRSTLTIDKSRAKTIRQNMFEILALGFKEILESMKTNDLTASHAHYKKMTENFKSLLENSSKTLKGFSG
jgi:radical SAM superfamily enzyme YgiQ (UPF0313 family)